MRRALPDRSRKPEASVSRAQRPHKTWGCQAKDSPSGGTCPACARKRSAAQSGLSLGRPGDAHEREAEGIAERMMGQAAQPDGRPSLSRVGSVEAGDTPPDAVARTLAGPARPIHAPALAMMERRFGRSFADVRVHAAGGAADSAAQIGARAYTRGRGIAFAAGQYRPGTPSGLRLLADELAHVVQQAGRSDAPVQRDLAVEPKGVNQKERVLSEQDIKAAIAFNGARIKKKAALREIRDIVGLDEGPVEFDRDLALAVGRWQAMHGVAQDGQLGPVTMMLLVEELQGAGSAAFKAAFNDAADWIAEEVNSRNTDKSLARWALSVLDRICP